jgi:hypothetical protein
MHNFSAVAANTTALAGVVVRRKRPFFMLLRFRNRRHRDFFFTFDGFELVDSLTSHNFFNQFGNLILILRAEMNTNTDNKTIKPFTKLNKVDVQTLEKSVRSKVRKLNLSTSGWRVMYSKELQSYQIEVTFMESDANKMKSIRHLWSVQHVVFNARPDADFEFEHD